MFRTTRLGVIALGGLLGLSATLTAVAPAQAADFYTPPPTLPSANGALVKTEPMKLNVSFPQLGRDTRLPGTATRIMYKSTNEAGESTPVTGVYIEPAKKWTGSGPRPLVSYSVGTMGVGDACTPSKTLEKLVNVEDGKLMFSYEMPFVYGFLNDGVAVVVTDYVGFGTPGDHTYMNRTDQANAVLDAARAALELPNTSITAQSPIGLFGYSQGGGASGAAVEMAPTYAPELNIKAAYSGAPPGDLMRVMKRIDGTSLAGVIPWAITAMSTYRPEMVADVETVLNSKGKAYLEKSRTQCLPDAVLAGGFTQSSSWTKSGKRAVDEVAKFPTILTALEDQKLGKRKPAVPVLVVTGTQDDLVDHAQARQVALDWCARGANVTYTPAIQLLPSGGVGLNHIGPAITHSGYARGWMVDRLKGSRVSGNCSTARLLP